MLTVTIFACVVAVAVSYPNGPPLSACTTMFPVLHNTTAQNTVAPFDIALSSLTYKADQEISVTLKVKTGQTTYYEGMFLQMRRTSGDKDQPIGTFSISTATAADLQLMACDSKANSAVSQKRKEHYQTHTVTWKAPAMDVGDLRIRGTIVHETDEFWVDVYSATLKYGTSGATTTALATGLLVSLAALAAIFSF